MTAVRFGSCAFAICLGLWAVSGSAGVSAPVPKDKELTRPFVQWAATAEFASNAPHDPLVVKDRVVVGTNQGELRAYRCKDGKPVWAHQHGVRSFHRLYSDGERIYFSSAKGLTAVTAEGGTKIWDCDLRF